MLDYLHDHKDFGALLNIVANEKEIDPALVEKDYWIMHCLYGLKNQGYQFELKGGTSLSKGYNIIHRFSEDIDIHIEPPKAQGINPNPKNTNSGNIAKRKAFYDALAIEIQIPGISSVTRDTYFDDIVYYRSGGIRLIYDSLTTPIQGVKHGVLLEAGFDNVTPNETLTISSWAYDKAIQVGAEIIDNRAVDVPCYHPGYTFVEKLQTIATKYRKAIESKKVTENFMRQYYDVYCLLEHPDVLSFIGTAEYQSHKKDRFPTADFEIPIAENEAFHLKDANIRKEFELQYAKTSALYYQGQPDFEVLLARIAKHLQNL